MTALGRRLALLSSAHIAATSDRSGAGAGVPCEVGFATKPELGLAMLARTHAAGGCPGG
jgi:hypothetical protein